MVNQIELTSPNNYIYKFKAIAPFNNRLSQTVIDIPLVNTTPQNTVLFRFTGKAEESGFTFYIFNDGVDASSGTAPSSAFPSGVITVDEQILYLKNYIFNEQYNAKWYITQDRYHPTAINGVITNLEFNNEAGRVHIVPVQMTFKIGNVGSF